MLKKLTSFQHNTAWLQVIFLAYFGHKNQRLSKYLKNPSFDIFIFGLNLEPIETFKLTDWLAGWLAGWFAD